MEETGSQEREKQEIPDYLWEAADFIQKMKVWQGTAADFLNAAGITGVQPNQFTRKLAEYYYDVFLPKKIRYESRRTSEARMLFFFYDDDDGHDGDSGISPSKKGDSEKTSSSPSQEENCADGMELVSQA